MIAFATFFLGLVMGTASVEMVPGEGVARVELFLDETSVGVLTSAPWKLRVDFGRLPEPHVLVAVARDAQGRETARARRWINRYPRMADASLVLVPGAGGKGRVATLSWESTVAVDPVDIRLSLDGRPLPNQVPSRILLPDFAPDQVHFLKAELDFPDKVTASAEIAFGGRQRDETETELTAAIVSVPKGAKLPAPELMDGWFVEEGRPLRAVSTEEGPAEIVAVVDTSGWRALGRIAEWDRPGLRVLKGQELRYMSPVPQRRLLGSRSYAAFPEFQALLPLKTLLFFRHPVVREDQRLRDALAVAGMSAARNNRRRAVILLAGPTPVDRSDLTSDALAHYLKSISTPFFVIGLDRGSRETAAAFGGSQLDGSNFPKLVQAFDLVTRAVDAQSIIWLEGRHLPKRIEISRLAHGLTRVD
jgi:hypothetical protein